MERSGSHSVAADVASNADRLVASLLEGAGDAHFRVAAAALAALGEGLASPCTRVFEPQLDRVMTALFARQEPSFLAGLEWQAVCDSCA
jgi:hypothetical protein